MAAWGMIMGIKRFQTKRLMILALGSLMIFLLAACSDSTTTNAVEVDTRNLSGMELAMTQLSGTDALGRKISPVDGPKTDKDRYVGLFYSLWLGQHTHQQSAIYNISHLMETPAGEETLFDPAGSDISRTDEFHFWGEPLYGYYNMQDPWVLTRHIELLTMAGVDYLCFDATNNAIYPEVLNTLLDLLLKYQNQGFDVPKIVFYTNSFSGNTVDAIYSAIYQTEKYQSLWFQPNGKPLIIGITPDNENASDQTRFNASFSNYISEPMREFFDVKESEWPNGMHNDNSIPWMSWDYPQRIHDGSIAVPVAQHSHSRISASFMDPESSRGYNNVTGTVEDDYLSGHSFQDMWNTVFENDSLVNNVLVTSFNEWMAIKLNLGGTVQFVDVFNEEYSRDIEMMKGGYNDNFYLQLVKNIREFKYEPAKNYQRTLRTIDITDSNSMLVWNYVKDHYQDFQGDAMPRDFIDAVNVNRYVDNSNRNDITDIKIANDKNNVYIYIKTLDPITAYNGSDLNWMNILLSTSGSSPSFAGYQYIINRHPETNTTSIERSTGGYQFETVGNIDYSIQGNVMQVKIPLAHLGLTADNVHFDFKVADNVTHYDDIMDYYVTGDSAPLGRLGYSY
ncbi:MAG: hypothetical protein GX582_01810 [Acholeplasmataceae bacterium]|nr:hypothetical protein [Acholeplasmataceae bacterium]